MTYTLDPDIRRAATLPASIYSDPALYLREKERIFARTWQRVARLDELQREGDFVATDLVGEPLLLTRTADGPRAFYNVCPHRAGQVACGKGNRKVLQCRYHGWTFNLQGKLLRTREMEGIEDFHPEANGLKPIAFDSWGPMAMVHLEQPERTLRETLGEIVPETAGFALDQLRFVERRDYTLDCNWKVYVENYLEGYHIPIAHPGLFQEIDYQSYRVELRRYHSRQWAPLRPVTDPDSGRQFLQADTDVFYYWVWPNLMINVYPDNVSLNYILPLGPDRTLTIFEWYLVDSASGPAWEAVQQGIAFSDQVQKEDIEICEAVQRGLSSRAYQTGRFCPKRENGVHHFQSLWCEFMQ